MRRLLLCSLVGTLSVLTIRTTFGEQPGQPDRTWLPGNTADLPCLHVTLSKPVLVGRSKG
jgi:hypothetical protein